VPDPEPCPDPCLVVLIKVKVHPCLDLNFAGSRQKNRPLEPFDPSCFADLTHDLKTHWIFFALIFAQISDKKSPLIIYSSLLLYPRPPVWALWSPLLSSQSVGNTNSDNSGKCGYCDNPRQSAEHLFTECTYSQRLFACFERKYKLNKKLTELEKLIGIDPSIERSLITKSA
jgi:hypothetical protein